MARSTRCGPLWVKIDEASTMPILIPHLAGCNLVVEIIQDVFIVRVQGSDTMRNNLLVTMVRFSYVLIEK